MRTLILSALILVACNADPEVRPLGAPPPADPGGQGGSAGAPNEGGSGGEGEGGSAPERRACEGDAAFWATGMSFTEPTAYPLAAALQASLYGYEGHGVSAVIVGDQVGVSATTVDEHGTHRFVDDVALTGLLRDIGGMRTADPQPRGWLRLQHGDDVRLVALENVALSARAADDCTQIIAVLDAVIPVDQGEVEVPGEGHDDTIAELAGETASGQLGWPIRALFMGEPITFDFDSVAP